jgi:2-keto-4-pentenoate hydratase/2-oxohepta-3-ene-1,7-dioic acid hydratase in catechol pathway
MKLFTFSRPDNSTRLGAILADGSAVDATAVFTDQPFDAAIPVDVQGLIELDVAGLPWLDRLQGLSDAAKSKYAVDLATVQWLAPIPNPRKNIFCVGRNYRAHIIEGNLARGRAIDDFPKAVEFFSKPPTSVVGHQAKVSSHAATTKMLDYEVELAIVMGKPGKDISADKAFDHIFGYTILNDVTARDLQARHGQWFKGKGLDTTCPIGPYVVPKQFVPNPDNLNLKMRINGELRQDASTSDLLFSIPEIIRQLADGMTLEAGDIIATGTPSGVGLGLTPQVFLKPGDVMAAEIDFLGELVNQICE